MKVFFDEKGRIKSKTYDADIVATSHLSDKIEAYADFDVATYTVSITLKRADGLSLGPYPMLAISDNDAIHHEYKLTKEDTLVPGPLQITIRYEIYALDEYGELELVHSKPTAMITAYIYEAVSSEDNKYVVINSRIDKLEEKIEKLETTGGYKEIEISRTEPEDKTKDKLWLKIL